MGAQKITEQQFRVRRRDRRMIWVDALAFLLGLLIVVASVTGVILIEQDPQPIDWTYSFAESRMPEKGICIGFIFTDAERRGCADRDSPPLDEKPALEGVPVEYAGDKWYLSAANVTSVTFELSWLDDIPVTTDGDCDDYCGRNFNTYDENSTDTLRLEIYTPWGETLVNQTANAVDPTNPAGTIRIRIPILEPEGGTIEAYTQKEASDRLNETYYDADHPAIGQWRTVVTVVRAGDINGTVPANACSAVGADDDTLEQCDSYATWQLVNGNWYDLYEAYGVLFENIPYSSTYVDEGNGWQLKMIVRVYEAMVSF